MIKLLNRLYFSLPVWLWLILAAYSVPVLLNVAGVQHLFFNLEPYPDSFTYIMPAWGASQGQGFGMLFGDQVQIPTIFSDYSIILAGFFLVWRNVQMVVVANLFLGWLALIFLYLASKELKFSHLTTFGVIGLYVLHGLVFWVAGLPMTENVALAALAGSVWLTLKLRHSHVAWVLWAQIALLGILFFSRLSMMPVALALGFMSGVACWFNRQRVSLVWLILATIVFGGIFLGLQSWMQEDAFRVAKALQETSQPHMYYSFGYSLTNTLFYSKSYLGLPQLTMWLNVAISSGLVVLAAVVGLLIKLKQKAYFVALVLLAGWSSQLVTLLLFYHADNRYLIGTIPFLVLSAGLTLEYVFKRWQWKVWLPFFGALVLALLISQKNIYQILVVDNLLARTTPWQYQAVQQLNATVSDNSTLVTALPPYLFVLYESPKFNVIPVSTYQEYISKQRPVWGTDINYDDLAQEIRTRLEAGETVYLTNAYITHLHEVVNDYEVLKAQFETNLVAEGCLGACNVYQLQLAPEELNGSN